jgi:hypothetical protein
MEIKMKTFLRMKLLFILTLVSVAGSYAQELSVGTDVVSRYIWRGTDFGDSPSIQPTVELGAGGFAVGFWGAYPTNEGTDADEVDFYAGYNFDINSSGSIYLGFTDYMFPTSGFELTNFNNYDDTSGAGSHYIEINAGYSGPESFPISLSLNVFFHNVMDNPLYFELGYSCAVQDVGLDFFVGGAIGDGAAYYGAVKDDGTPKTFDIVNAGITASKEIKFTDDFSLPIFGSVIVNPATESLFYVFGFSL